LTSGPVTFGTWLEMSAVPVGPDAVVRSRMPSAEERRRLGIDEGIPVFVVSGDNGSRELYPPNRTELRFADV
jgi:hypothetical protein